METPGSLPDSYASLRVGLHFLLSPSRHLELGQERRRLGDPPSCGPADVERDHVGCCRRSRARTQPETATMGYWPSGSPQENRDPARLGKGGGSLRIIPGPPLAVAVATTQEGKSKQFAEGGPQSPFRQRTHLASPPLSAPFYPALRARLVSSGPGDFPFCRPSQTANGTPRHNGKGTLTLWGVGGTPAPLPKRAAAASSWRGHCCFSPAAS